MYNVVFEGTGKEYSNTKGVRTWTGYASKEEFDEFMLRGTNSDVIIAEGISEEDAIKLVEEQGEENLIMGAIEGSINSAGRLDPEVLKARLGSVSFLLGALGKERGSFIPPELTDGEE